MLVLTRNVGESLHIGDDIVVTILGVKGNQVRIGIKAPEHVAVWREELYHRVGATPAPALKSPVDPNEPLLPRRPGIRSER